MSGSADANSAITTAKEATLTEEVSGGKLRLIAKGDWVSATISNVNIQLRKYEDEDFPQKELVFEMDQVGMIDTSGSWLIVRLRDFWIKTGRQINITGASQRAATLLNAIKVPNVPTQTKVRYGLINNTLYSIGRLVKAVKRDAASSLAIIGAAALGPQSMDGKGRGIRFVSIAYHIDRMGVRAVPIIVLMSLLLGAIVAQQAAFQLRFFGFETLAADFTAASLLREIAVLLTAIMIAGRSGSSMTAELGSMKMREEIDALNVIGLNPIGVLIFPRLVALTICLPILTFISNMAALTGAALVLRFYSDMPIEEYLARIRAYIDLETVFSGLIKAPFMGFAVGLMSAVEGLKVEGSAESLGRRTTAAVVKSIFMVILIDGFFSVFYASIDY